MEKCNLSTSQLHNFFYFFAISAFSGVSGTVTIFLCALCVFAVNYSKNGSGRGSVWLERDVRDVEVAGSNPVAPTKIKENKNDERERNIKLLEL